ncbi:MAG: hypothetical protein ACUVRN_02790 [Candidatus Caldatribacteriaceae bacterium]
MRNAFWDILSSLLLGLLFWSTSSGWAQDTLDLTGKRLLYQVEKNEVIVYQGKVHYKDVVLEAEKIHLFLDQEELEAEGKVLITRENEGIAAEKVFYNWRKDWWKMQKVRFDVTGASISGKLYFRGEEIEEKRNTTEIQGANFTGCDLEEPHYYIEAKKIVIFPNRRVVLYNLSYWDFGRRLFSLGYYSFFLDRVDQLPLFPSFGYSRSTGFYLGYFYNYVVNDYSFGTILATWWQKNGWSVELRHYLDNEDHGESGKMVLSYRDYPDSPSTFTGKVEYSKKWDEFTSLSGSINYAKTIGRLDDNYFLLLSLNRNKEDEVGKLNLSYNADWKKEKDSLSATLTYKRKVTENLWGGLEFFYLQDAKWNVFEDQDLRYLLFFQKTQDKWTYTLRYYGHSDIEGDMYTGDAIQVVRKMPELEVVKDKERIGNSDFSYSYGIAAGCYLEEETGVKGSRLNLYLNITGNSKIGESTIFKPSLYFEQNFYGSDFARYLWSNNFALEHNFSSLLSLSLAYNWRGYKGATPFKFDYITKESNFLSANLAYNREPWKFNIETGYDLLAKEFTDITLGIKYTISSKKQVTLQGSYNVTSGTFGGMSFSIDWPIGKEWNMGFKGVWDFQEGELDGLKIRLTKDLHCREISFYYDKSEKSFWLEYGLKVFPSQKFKIGG